MNDDPIPEGWTWRQFALCAQVDIGEMWFPEKGGSTRDAKKVCAACPVRAECLDYALKNGERYGIWGGLSERERRRLGPAKGRTGTRHRVLPDEEVARIYQLRGTGLTEAVIADRLGIHPNTVRKYLREAS